MISPSGPLQKAYRKGVGSGMLWMTKSFGSVVITTPAARAPPVDFNASDSGGSGVDRIVAGPHYEF